MRIIFEPLDAPSVELTGLDKREWPDELRINGRPLVQEAQFLRAEKVKMFARGNRKTIVSFTVKRLHNNVQAAQVFMIQHYNSLPSDGTVRFKLINDSGGSQDLTMVDSVLGTIQYWHVGKTTFFRYSIEGGKIE